MKIVKKEVNKKEFKKKEFKKDIEKEVKKEVNKNLSELNKLAEDIKKYTFAYQNCISNICVDEKVAIMKDTNKDAPKINLNILLEKDEKKRNEFFKKHVEYPLNFNLHKCNFNACGTHIKNMIHCILKVSVLMKKLKREDIKGLDDDFYKRFDYLLKKQNLSDEELKDLMIKFLSTTLNMRKN
jgi:hypothetical protein